MLEWIPMIVQSLIEVPIPTGRTNQEVGSVAVAEQELCVGDGPSQIWLQALAGEGL